MLNQVQSSPTAQDLFCIRHAQSNFNKGYLNYKLINNLNLNWYQCIQIEQFNHVVAYSKDYIDCGITEEGKEQCKAARQTMEKETVDIVLVSPHQRALETCRQIFGQGKVKVEVHPLLAQVFRFSCDIGNHIEQKINVFPEYDFSFMKDHSQLWFVQILSDHLKDTCNQHLQRQSGLTYQQKQEKLLHLLQSKVVYESPQELRARAWKIKEMLDGYRKKYKKIAIVSHFQLLQSLLAKSYNQTGQTSELQMIPNAIPIKKSIDELLSVK